MHYTATAFLQRNIYRPLKILTNDEYMHSSHFRVKNHRMLAFLPIVSALFCIFYDCWYLTDYVCKHSLNLYKTRSFWFKAFQVFVFPFCALQLIWLDLTWLWKYEISCIFAIGKWQSCQCSTDIMIMIIITIIS